MSQLRICSRCRTVLTNEGEVTKEDFLTKKGKDNGKG